MQNKRNKNVLKVAILILIISLGYLMINFAFKHNKKQVEIRKQKFDVEVVKHDWELRKGLGQRDDLCDNCGMLFEFPVADHHPFWMKDMYFDLDLIWIMEGRIVHVEKNVSKDSRLIYSPLDLSDQVLELKAGTADKYLLEVGDEVNS